MSDSSNTQQPQQQPSAANSSGADAGTKGPNVAALPSFVRGGRALERAEQLDREGHSEASAAAGGHGDRPRMPYITPGQDATK
ncbi:uncharacterized protein PFL1_00137 [Pseudozyma flocculosa PF-1]|nr:uncharacterized protein PFL1_00137 [Pseudozyma flocculosa PF-1]EPQ31938.1 hypothetical protein PFL1_00137 [Pseudozyma flocculosa PF-1]